MHELSIAMSIVEMVSEQVAEAGGGGVRRVTLRIGRLAGVHAESLRFSFDLIREGTPLAEAELVVIDVPVRIWCPACATEVDLRGVQSFACPFCGMRSGDIRAGRELEVESIELSDEGGLTTG